MSSYFETESAEAFSNEWHALDSDGSERFRFFKARVHGKLHFVKTLSDSGKHDLRSIQALRKEFEIGYNLDHPNIARYFYFENNAIFEEYIDGKTIRRLLDEQDPILNEKGFIERIVRQLLEAVEYIHSMGVLHLDLKPENVMITRVGGNVKVIDFGCAYTAADDSTQGFTLQYKAPEQGSGETNAYTDIYLIGKIAEELAAITGVSSQWKHFISKATAETPADRFKTEKEALAAIPPKRHKKWPYLVAAILVLCAVALIPVFRRDLPAATPDVARTITNTDSLPASPPAAEQPAEPFSEPVATTIPPVTQTPAQPKIDVTTLLEKEITSKISADYLTNVLPACNYENADTNEAYYNFLHLMKQAQLRSLKLCDSLIGLYPDRAEFIRNKVYETINSQQSHAGVTFFGK